MTSAASVQHLAQTAQAAGEVDQVVHTIPWLPLTLQRRAGQVLQRVVSGRMQDFGLPEPNHRFLEAHPTVSSELLLRLGSGDATAKPNVAIPSVNFPIMSSTCRTASPVSGASGPNACPA